MPFLALIAVGALWGAGQPLAKTAVSEGYRHVGILFWQLTLGALLFGAVTLLRGRSLRFSRRDLPLLLFVALAGTVLPGISSYTAAVHLPSGLISILLSAVPMFTFPLALALGTDRFAWRRLAGLSLGLGAVALLVLPETSLPDPDMARWIPVALISSVFYAIEGNVVGRWGTGGLDPVKLLAGASALGAGIVLPLALATGQFIDPRGPWGAPEFAILAGSGIHALAYSGYVALVAASGAVFAVQVSYLVTLFGVFWAMLFLGESYGGAIWGALLMMLAGMALVQPRPRRFLVSADTYAKNDTRRAVTGDLQA
ncbi:DMT family transporter [Salipiger mangrovisoli]|uniref:DMT family transporter n=1 Tax=Salipiger mangrovisoli TaxID=2865933 RepID=UPI001F11B79B|nr:DMT family transporter [Salipiger mangrovisoli]